MHSLIYACRNGHFPVIKYLAEKGADITEVIAYSYRYGYFNVFQYLSKKDATYIYKT